MRKDTQFLARCFGILSAEDGAVGTSVALVVNGAAAKGIVAEKKHLEALAPQALKSSWNGERYIYNNI